MNQSWRNNPTAPHAPMAGETLADLGEWELIRRLGAFAPPGQFCDDAALLTPDANADGTLVLNTDVLVEGIHFSDATTGAADVGWRAAAANLSDLAAMGATEVVGLTVGLVAPSDTRWSWVEEVYRGIHQCLEVHGGELLGGDCSGGAQRVVAITALGRLPHGHGAIRRGDGRPGDRLVCTGAHGLSRLGLAWLQGGWADTATTNDPGRSRIDLADALIERAINAHRRPVPRFDAVRALINCRPVGQAWRVGGCDSSDGLAAAVAAIARASGCAARLDRAGLPVDPAMAPLPQGQAWCLNGGEDFELVLALAPTWAEALLRVLPGSQGIGALLAGAPGELAWMDGGAWGGDGPEGEGYQHFH